MAAIDRISALPDDVLVHILSFLTTKISVSTGVLSKRWSFLWAHVPNLDFDSYDFDEVLSFSNIVNGVMARHKGHKVHTFRLFHRREYGCTGSELERWTAFAIERNVQKLYIFLRYQEVLLPECIFTCKTLVDLCLSFYGDIPTTSNVSLPSLKMLSLEMVDYESDDSLAHMLSGCPVLEELVIQIANYTNTRVWCCISSPTLNRLVLVFNQFEDEAFRVKIDTPALRYLKLCNRVSPNVSVGCLPYLNEANIYFVNKETEVDILHFHNVMEFVGKLHNVKTLKLSTGWMEGPDSVFSNSNTIKFHNLRELHLDADWRFITIFLEIADNLRSLTICAGLKSIEYWVDPKQAPTCLVSRLGTVRIAYFRCTEQAFNMIRYILRNAKVLKVMEIYFQNCSQKYSNERSEASRIISLFERGSESCQLAFPRGPSPRIITYSTGNGW